MSLYYLLSYEVPDLIKELMKSLREYRFYALITPVLMVGEVLMEVLIPTLMAKIIDNGVYRGDMAYVERMSILIVLSALCSLTFGVLGSFTAAKGSTGFAKNLRHDIFDKIESFSFKNIDSFSTSSLITRITTDVQNVQNSMQMLIRICFRAPIMFIIAIIMVYRNGGSLVIIFALAIPVLALFIYNNMTSVHPIFSRVFKQYDNLNRTVEENITGIRTVKANVREEYETEKFDSVSQSIHDDFVLAQKKIAMMHPFMTLISYACMLLLAWFGAHLILDGKLGTGELMSVFTYTMMILMNLMMIAFIILTVTMSRASAQRIVEVLRTESEMDENENGISEVPDGSVSFKAVSFSYGGDANVLNDIEFDIESGETIGILGQTGSGKSTLISLIGRLYEATNGEVRVGGHNVKEYRLSALRRNVSVVLQKNQLFSGTIRSNMQWGDESVTDEEIKKALESSAADFVFSNPLGLDAPVDQGGTNFSGGQRQRLCIARALVRKPKILIFDDSTSAVDTATDKKIRRELKEISPDATKFIIAQRVSSVIDSDRIIILDKGRVQDIGTHSELLERNEMYRGLVNTQLGGKENG